MTSRSQKGIGAFIVVVGVLATSLVLTFEQHPLQEIGMNGTVRSADGTEIAYTTLGTGPALIIVDGAFCYRDNGPAAQLASILAEHFTVLTYDRRGRGESSDSAHYATAREVEDLRSLVKEAHGSAFAVGISSGGALALQAVEAGVKLSGLALYEPPFIADNGRPRSYLSQRQHLNELVSRGDRAGAVRFFMTNIYEAPAAFVRVMPIVMRKSWTKNKSVAHTLEYDLALLEDWSVLQEPGVEMVVPTLVMGGAKSPATLREAVAMVAGKLPNARQVYLEGQDHNLSPPAVAPVIVDFFGSIAGGATARGVIDEFEVSAASPSASPTGGLAAR